MQWMKGELREKCFRGWPKTDETHVSAGPSLEKDGMQISSYDMMVEESFPIRIITIHAAGLKPKDIDQVMVNVMDEGDWKEFANTYASRFPGLFPKEIKVTPEDAAFEFYRKVVAEEPKNVFAYVFPRGIGTTRWDSDAEFDTAHPREVAAAKSDRIQRWRRFYLIGQTLESQQVWDIRCAVHALRAMDGFKNGHFWLRGSGDQGINAMYARPLRGQD